MDIIQRFLAFALLGATWVMWVLVALSVISVAIMIERLRFFLTTRIDLPKVAAELAKRLRAGSVDEAKKLMASERSVVETAILTAGLEHASEGPEVAEAAMEATRAMQLSLLERNLTFLGTVGNNAPFIGLLGTVIGIIKAFHALSRDTQGGAAAVMYEISEALVATAIGLFVAIPAVMAFNYFRTRVKLVTRNVDALSQVLISHLKGKHTTTERS